MNMKSNYPAHHHWLSLLHLLLVDSAVHNTNSHLSVVAYTQRQLQIFTWLLIRPGRCYWRACHLQNRVRLLSGTGIPTRDTMSSTSTPSEILTVIPNFAFSKNLFYKTPAIFEFCQALIYPVYRVLFRWIKFGKIAIYTSIHKSYEQIKIGCQKARNSKKILRHFFLPYSTSY